MKNFLRTSIFSLLIVMFCLTSTLFAPPQPGAYPPPSGMNPQDMQAFDAELQKLLEDPKAMEEMTAFAEKLMAEDPEFKKLVEDMAVEMEQEFKKQGIDLNQLPQQPAPQVEVPAPLPPLAMPKPTPPTPTVSKKTIKEIKNILETIAEKLGDIRQKAADDKEFKKLFEPWQFHVDDIIYYANLLMEDHLIKYLAEKEFESLYENLKLFAQALEQLEPKIESKEFSLGGENPYSVLDIAPTSSYTQVEDAYRSKLKIHKKPETIANQMKLDGRTQEKIDSAKQQATTEIKTIEDAFKEIRTYEQSKENLRKLLEFDVRTIIYTLDIKSQIKKLLEKHDPEALAIAKEREKEEAEARKKQEEAIYKRIPPYAPPAFYIPPFTQYPGAGYQDYYPPYGGAPYVAPSTQQPSQPAVTFDETGKAKGKGGSPARYPAEKKEKTKEEEEAAKKKALEESKEKGLKEAAAADPKVEAAVKAFQDHLGTIEEKLTAKIGSSAYKPEGLFKIERLKDLLQGPVGQQVPDEIVPMQAAFNELNFLITKTKKNLNNTMKTTTAVQKSSIKKQAQEVFNAFEKEELNKRAPVISKLTIDQDDKLILNGTQINVQNPDIHFILRGKGMIGASDQAKKINPDSYDAIKEFLDSYNGLKRELGIAVVPPVPIPPAAPAP